MSIQQTTTARSGKYGILVGSAVTLVGLILLAYPFIAAVVTAEVLGWLLLLAAASLLLYASTSSEGGSQRVMHVLTAVLVGIGGVVLLASPVLGVVSLTVIIGVVLLLRAISELILAFQIKPARVWSALLVNGILVGLIGLMILSSWPASSLWAIGTLLAISVISNGISRLALAVSHRQQPA